MSMTRCTPSKKFYPFLPNHFTDVATISSLDEDEIQISSKQLKIIMEDLAKKTLEPFQVHHVTQNAITVLTPNFHFQVQMFQKIKDKEDLLASRLSKLEKSLNVV